MATKLTDWLQRFLWIAQLVFISVAVFVTASALDRAPPFAVLTHKPIVVRAGTMGAINVPVWRDLDRHCDATLDRYIFDATGRRFDVLSGVNYPDSLIRKIAADSPGRLVLGVPFPPLQTNGDGGIVPGPARLVSQLLYVCNKGHYIWPIQVQAEINIIIAP